ncbi:carbohydrate kinase family protein [Mesorhizobium sp. GR13]|uniref:carbohydrate kinase family protein n=1 Tax=Mesorhizobium sp. GR13 TaxID=2562308 RepID=UPI0010C15415|nr:carbohydrate kinase family protein [Mesorhizobium sp. GR13]
MTLCIVGNLNIDLMIYGLERLPGWGEEQFGKGRRAVTSGQAGYMAIAAASLGLPVSIIGVVGADDDGRKIQADLKEHGVDCSGISVIEGVSTGLTVAIIRGDGERCFVSDVGASSAMSAERIDNNWDVVAAADAMAVVGIFNTPRLELESIQRLFAKAQQAGIYTVFDPGWDAAGWPKETRAKTLAVLPHVDLFLPNEDEALAITDAADVHVALEQLAFATSGQVVIKRGSKGSLALSNGEILEVTARPVEGANAVGAGDVYDAALVTALRNGRNLHTAMAFAGRAAEYYVARLDDRYPSQADLA